MTTETLPRRNLHFIFDKYENMKYYYLHRRDGILV